ncbi:MAG: hypothetical protein L6263_05530 [Desulfobacteraceae bacterium]|nr:hypothetical protein [Desulfobacteraceae bacterium]
MSVLFEKTEIQGMELKNRLVCSATHEAMADDEGFPTDLAFLNCMRVSQKEALG